MASGPVTRRPPQATATEQQPRCPRCNSPDTKFCYYNNYNLSQPRHFCKSCRRYWTLGGTLRNVPIGGSTRRHHTSSSNPSRRRRSHHRSTTVQPISAVPPAEADTFAALLTEQLPSGFLALGDPFTQGSSGYRVGFGFEDVGFGVDHRTGWSYYCGDLMGVESRLLPGSGGGAGLCDTWHVADGGGGEASGCLVWPDLGVSTGRNVE